MSTSRIMESIRNVTPVVLFVAFVVGFVIFLMKWSGRGGRADSEIHYINDKCVIVRVGGFQDKTHDKHATSYTAKYFLIRRVADTTMYSEMNSWNWKHNGAGFTDSLYYDALRRESPRFQPWDESA